MSLIGSPRPPLSAFPLFVLAGAVVAVGPFFVDGRTTDLLIRGFIFAVFALSLDIAWGYTGIFSLGHSAFFGIGAYSVAVVVSQAGNDVVWVVAGLLIGLVLAGSAALVVGWFAFFGSASAFYIGVITFVLAIVLERLAALTSFETLSDVTGGANGLSNFTVVSLSLDGWYWASLVLLVAVGFAGFVVVRSDAGRFLLAIRESESRMRYLGVRTERVKLFVFASSAVVAALSGAVFAAYVQFVSPSLFGLQIAILVLIMVAVGGRGTLLGPILGAMIISIAGPTVSARWPFAWELILGIAFVAVVLIAPDGLIRIIERVARLVVQYTDRYVGQLRKPRAGSTLVPVAMRDSNGRADASMLCEINGVAKAYGSLRVLDDVDLEIRSNEILCLIGANGAGKSTLINVLTDGTQLSAGVVRVCGRRVDGKGPASIVREGVGRTFQGAKLFEDLTVADALFIAGRRGSLPSPLLRTDSIEVPAEVTHLAGLTGLVDVIDVKAKELAHGLRQALEMAMALSLDPELLLLDEPTAGLTHEERRRVGDLLRELLARRRIGLVLIEHDLDFVRGITDRVAVLHRGRIHATGSVEELASSDLVREIYLGTTR